MKAKKFVIYNKVTEKILNIHGDWVDDLGSAHLFTKVSAERRVNYISHQAKRYPDVSVGDLVVLPVHLKIKKGDLSLC